MFELVVEKTIAAAHYLRDFSGPCERLHGHNYKVEVFLRGSALSKAGMLEDFTDIKRAMNDVLGRLDHYCLNDLPEFADVSPSAENLAKFIGDTLAAFPFERGRVHRVRVWETPTQGATYFVEQSSQE
jgi:6-pyruvoyltetrahydropterin/6-carboxytetrahydropterin synthase